MISVYDIKPLFQNLLRPIVRRIDAAGMTANQVTVFTCIACVVWGFGLYVSGAHKMFLIGLPVLLFVRMALNAIDGMLAREFGHKSDLGFYLNELTDVVSDIALYLPFVVVSGISPALVLLVVIISVLTEIAGILALGLGKERRYDGPFGKSDRALTFGTLAFAAGLFTLSPWLLNGILALFSMAGIYTIYNRINGGLTHA